MKKMTPWLGFITIISIISLALTACSNPAGDNDGTPPPPPLAPYIITGESGAFTVTSPSGTALVEDETMGNVISAIRTDANGSDIDIQLGENDVSFAGGTISLNDTDGDWGHITLRGRTNSTINIGQGVSLTSTINGTASFNLTGNANLTITGGSLSSVVHNSTGLLTITGGIISSQFSEAIRLQHSESRMLMSGGTVRLNRTGNDFYAIYVQSNHENAVVISGGTVGGMNNQNEELTPSAIRHNGTGGITIRGDALITSRNPSENFGTIRLDHATGGTLRIEGGTVRNWNPNTGSFDGPAIAVTAANDEARKARVTHTSGTISPMPEWLD